MDIDEQLYGGAVTIKRDRYHRYIVNGELFDGVTTPIGVLDKPGLTWWATGVAADYLKENWLPKKKYDELEIYQHIEAARKQHDKVKNETAFLGTFVHDYAEKKLRGEKAEVPQNAQLMAAAQKLDQFFEGHEIEPVFIERPVVSLIHRFAGQSDLIAMIDGKLTVLDWKTSKAIYDSALIQSAGAYSIAIEEETGKPIEQAMVVTIPLLEQGQEITVTDLEPYKRTFLQCLDLYRFRKEQKKVLETSVIAYREF